VADTAVAAASGRTVAGKQIKLRWGPVCAPAGLSSDRAEGK